MANQTDGDRLPASVFYKEENDTDEYGVPTILRSGVFGQSIFRVAPTSQIANPQNGGSAWWCLPFFSLSLSLLTTEPFFYSFPHKHNSLFLLNLLITSIFMTIVSPTCQTQAFHFLVSKNDTTSSSFPAKNRSPCPLLLFLPPVPSAFSAVRRRSIAVATSVA